MLTVLVMKWPDSFWPNTCSMTKQSISGFPSSYSQFLEENPNTGRNLNQIIVQAYNLKVPHVLSRYTIPHYLLSTQPPPPTAPPPFPRPNTRVQWRLLIFHYCDFTSLLQVNNFKEAPPVLSEIVSFQLLKGWTV